MTDDTPARLLVRSLLAALLGATACDDGAGEPSRAHRGAGAAGGAPAQAAGASGGGAGSFGGAGGGRNVDPACREGVPQLVEGVPTGMQLCADGTLARVAATTCRLADLTKDAQCPLGQPAPTDQQGGGQQCEKVCDEAPFGRPRFGQFEPRCAYFCASDADCPSGTTCACEEAGIGQCASGPCKTAADCGAGSSCRLTDTTSRCDFTGFRWLECIGPEDACVTDEDCAPGGPQDPPAARISCGNPLLGENGGTAKTCGQAGALCGRPLLVDAVPAIAPLVRNRSWATKGPA